MIGILLLVAIPIVSLIALRTLIGFAVAKRMKMDNERLAVLALFQQEASLRFVKFEGKRLLKISSIVSQLTKYDIARFTIGYSPYEVLAEYINLQSLEPRFDSPEVMAQKVTKCIQRITAIDEPLDLKKIRETTGWQLAGGKSENLPVSEVGYLPDIDARIYLHDPRTSQSVLSFDFLGMYKGLCIDLPLFRRNPHARVWVNEDEAGPLSYILRELLIKEGVLNASSLGNPRKEI